VLYNLDAPRVPEPEPNTMLLVDGQGRMVCVSAQPKKMFGYRRKELVGEPVEKLTSERCRGEHVKASHSLHCH